MEDDQDIKAIKKWLEKGDLKQIAEDFKVSPATVTNALHNQDGRQDILEAIIAKSEARKAARDRGRERVKALRA